MVSKKPALKEGLAVYPYTRGIHHDMYKKRLWTMRQYAGFGSAEESNKRYQDLLGKGQTGLSIAFDLPTQMGYDPDSKEAEGEVGRVGVSIATRRDMEILLKGIPLKDVSISMTINSTAIILLAMLIAVAEKKNCPLDKLSGTVQNDILKEYIARGTYIFPPEQSLRIVTDIFEWAGKNLPRFNTISISGYHIREAGSTAIQEVAFTLANAITYIESAIKRGLSLDSFGERLSFFFSANRNFLEEIAKFRAARRLYARLMKERFGARNPRAMMLRFHVQTAGSTLTAQQPLLNVIRVAYEAMSAVMGGAQSLHTNSYDEAIGLPTIESATIALRTQQILAFETGITNHPDPFGGSYVIEELTDEIEIGAMEIIKKIDEMGGMIRAIEEGYPQGEIEKSAYIYQKGIEGGENIIVGVNRYEEALKGEIKGLVLNPELEISRSKENTLFKQERDKDGVRSSLKKLSDTAGKKENIFPAILNAVKMDCSVGEISDCLRRVFGTYRVA